MASIGPSALGAKGCIEGLHRFAQGVVGAFKNVGRQYDKTKQPPLRAMEKRPPFGAYGTTFPPLCEGTIKLRITFRS